MSNTHGRVVVDVEQADDIALLADFAALSAIGATPAGGVERQAATPEDGQTRAWLQAWLAGRGFTVAQDRVGNLFGLLELVPGAPYVLAGSHLDSQPRGGRFDGAYGVLAAAHAAERLRRHYAAVHDRPRYNIAVVDWFNEEGSRFKPSMMGSGVFTGALPLEQALATTDVGGVTVGEALDAMGARGEADVFGENARRAVAAYAEIHIEQGRELEKAGIGIGLVDSTWAANKYELSVLGSQAHTGATAMADRRDALYGAALVVVAVRELADRFGLDLHTSCGQLTVYPNSPVVVAREVHMHLDLRSPSDELLAEADELLRVRLAEIEVQADVTINRTYAHTWRGQVYQPEGVELARSVATDLGLASVEVRTRAGHDSTNMKDRVPTVMLFVPSVDGISHAESEFTHDEDLCRGTQVLTETLARILQGAFD
ncbi:M20 family metallo-hydrolase [Pseudonocardia sp. RS11V-5]|uniref:M20 family metallo-hydrolase n=1 Tax=Pseudonocardia terrae TaxID=2905831 RepID=UPI001E63306A|nr:M20 family metallo-hydrolase [Pseudonocardia terrae]MCE3554384.1 M20 family metallo-hydrolase [Pseudonocardia terrae]